MTLLLVIWLMATALGAILLVWRTLCAWFSVFIAGVRLLRIDDPTYDMRDRALTLMLRCLIAAWVYSVSLVFLWVVGEPFTGGQVVHELIDIMTGIAILIALWVADRLLQQRVTRSTEHAGSHSPSATG